MISLTTLGITEAEALRRLYNASKPQGMGYLHYNPAPMTAEQAETILAEAKTHGYKGEAYFDYLSGRIMKVKIGPEINEALYDRDNGPGAALRALSQA